MSDLIAAVRNQFSVFIVEGDVTSASQLREAVSSFGYTSCQEFAGADEVLSQALSAARVEPPHVILFDLDRFEVHGETFLQAVREISSEILVIELARADQSVFALQLISSGLAYDSVQRPLVSSLELLQTIDRAVQGLYYQFESEQLREALFKLESLHPLPTAAEPGPLPALDFSSIRPADHFGQYVERISITKDLDETIEIFIQALSQELSAPVLYLKYLASHASLLISHAARVPIEKLRGVGIDLRKDGAAKSTEILRNPSMVPALRELIRDVFKKSEFVAIPHFNDGDAVGVCIVLNSGRPSADAAIVGSHWSVFELAWKKNNILKEKHALDILDSLTGLIHRRQFLKCLDEEMSRARRILMPLSLITIDVDRFREINQRIGMQQSDSILRVLGQILKKTARVSDVVARTGPDEFICLLPHTPALGATVKAERIRRIVEATKFPLLNGGSVSVSCGVSDYPALCSDGDSLMRSSLEALDQVRLAGGNKVCLAIAPIGHQPDFNPREVPKDGGFR